MPGPASGIPAKGPGYGGSAKGAGKGGSKRQYQSGNKAATGRRQPDPVKMAQREAVAAEMRGIMADVARNSESDFLRAQTAERLHNILVPPIQRTITHATDDASDLDDAALERRRAELEAQLRGGAGGAAPEEVPG